MFREHRHGLAEAICDHDVREAHAVELCDDDRGWLVAGGERLERRPPAPSPASTRPNRSRTLRPRRSSCPSPSTSPTRSTSARRRADACLAGEAPVLADEGRGEVVEEVGDSDVDVAILLQVAQAIPCGPCRTRRSRAREPPAPSPSSTDDWSPSNSATAASTSPSSSRSPSEIAVRARCRPEVARVAAWAAAAPPAP